ncbi:hypothetical protein [Pseudoxanthomonas putridarboris]|uniref:Uncharacterized protein n=1 Tax=Pseudoxanthomonas putridarboris TaxID=752605 RepID=A0ABU9J2V8_9GAMM
MLFHNEDRTRHTLHRLEIADARATGQLEALTVWVAALVQSHPDGERLRAAAQALSSRNPFRALCQYAEEVAAYEATFCQLKSLSAHDTPAPSTRPRGVPPPNV